MRISVRNLQLICAGFIVLWLNASSFALVGGSIPSLMKYGIVVVWLACAVCSKQQFITAYVKTALPLLIMLCLIFLSNICGITQYYSSYFSSYLYACILIALYVFYFNWGTKKELKVLIIIFLLDFMIKTVRTYALLLENPIIVRALSTNADSQNYLLEGVVYKGIGNYDWCYQLAFIVLLLLPMIENRNKAVHVLVYAVIAFFMVILFTAQITMAFLMLAMFIFIYYAFQRTNSVSAFAVKLCIGLAIVGVILNMESIVTMLISVADVHMAERLKNLWYSIKTLDVSSGDIGSRMDLYTSSWNYFLDSPIWGSFGGRTLGFHSSFLDLLGSYGILGVCGIYGILNPIRKTILKLPPKNNIRFAAKILFISFIFFSIVNVSIWCGVYMVVILIIPLGLRFLNIEAE